VFPVRYDLNLYILCKRNSVFKGLITVLVYLTHKLISTDIPSPSYLYWCTVSVL
jgi:hypothetical protein